jgi:hypothetical protein
MTEGTSMPQFIKRYVCGLCGSYLFLDRRMIRTVLFNGSTLEPRWRVVTADGRDCIAAVSNPANISTVNRSPVRPDLTLPAR